MYPYWKTGLVVWCVERILPLPSVKTHTKLLIEHGIIENVILAGEKIFGQLTSPNLDIVSRCHHPIIFLRKAVAGINDNKVSHPY